MWDRRMVEAIAPSGRRKECFYQKPRGVSKVPTHSFSPTFAPWWMYQIRDRASTGAKRVREKKEKLEELQRVREKKEKLILR